jgi:hypothetical protein
VVFDDGKDVFVEFYATWFVMTSPFHDAFWLVFAGVDTASVWLQFGRA